MIHPAVQKVPDSLHSTFHLRTMKHNRNQRQIKQKSQYPRQPAESPPRVLILQRNVQGYVRQENNPHPMIQALQLVGFRSRNPEPMLVHQPDNKQNGCQIGQSRHNPQRHTHIRINPFILIQKELMINLHKNTG